MLHTLLRHEALIYAALLIVFTIYAGWHGGPSERIAAAINAVASMLTPFAFRSAARWIGPETGILLVDGLTLAAFGALMGGSRRFWPMWVVAIQIVTVIAHVARVARPGTMPLAYAILETGGAYLVMGTIAGAVWRRGRKDRSA